MGLAYQMPGILSPGAGEVFQFLPWAFPKGLLLPHVMGILAQRFLTKAKQLFL